MARTIRLGRVNLGLYNSYDPVKFHEAHRRALARAGPLCLAFDLNLVTFGFPYNKELRTPVEIADWVADSTSIGRGGSYFKELAGLGRFSAFDFPSKGLPPQLGDAIATTSKPTEGRRVDTGQVARKVADGRSVCLLFGLGPRGLPKDAIRICQAHLDVTAKGYSLETCTAMGSVCGALARAISELAD